MTRPAPQAFTVLPSIHVYSMVSMVTRVLFVAVVLWGSPRIFAHMNRVKDFIAAAGFWLNTHIAMARKRASFRLLHSATRIRSTVMKNADFFSKMKGEQDAASVLPTKRGPLPPTASVVWTQHLLERCESLSGTILFRRSSTKSYGWAYFVSTH